ncbi:phosphatase PAP2 family protein [Deinococcus metallilatus]|uniref:Phosphatase PAP2 family protein n=1 Tax=Deinococcus metallilatus TaxID=1211322 RepID=A0AAJ5F3K6_9DEIO|nr:phosphatase PAP2 family protein [Deinococcus metallilatus]MBB5294121.1 undecaprenyl-diphosphatase [Deinococcus metallilatus]QBY08905.1 phosphatase PAP2 family protein [Deinococcus metallilatus]RXJ10049.1 phosphatase PAP2 family protein [Deinococcus metallilatus]TLK28014.1 phosphatase PAP2 family protein [Deinococcus metallilatus]
MRRDLPDLLARHWTQLALLLLGVLVPLLLLADLTEDVFREGGFAWDRTVLAWYAAHRTPGLTLAARALAVLGGLGVLPFVTAATALWLARLGARAHAWFLVWAVAGATLLNVLAKLIFQRPRPTDLGAVLTERGFSFPSGHAMSNMAFGYALVLVFWHTRARWPVAVLGFAWAFAVGASRNYLGVHYPTDVLAGFAASIAWVAGLYLILGQRWPRLRQAPGAEEREV